MSETEEKPIDEKEQTIVPRNRPVERFSDGKPILADYDPRKERFADGKPIEGAATPQQARQYAKYTDIVHGVGEMALTPYVGPTGAKAVRGGLELLEGIITDAATKRA